MITAQDIREKGFERVRLNGYDMAAVDDFLEELADDVAASQKENAVLKSKMKVLVDKIEEYRANEEALNSAILSAQKLAVQIETEARQRAAATIADAEKKAQETIGSISARADAEEKRLADAKAACAKFFEAARSLCNGQLGKLEAIEKDFGIPAAPEEAPADVEETVRAIESSAARVQPESPVRIDLADQDDKAFPAQRKLDNTQTFSL
ncbi:MAG: DivIVA domain-containing protein [Oscillospiraceae bacterium]|nr:DivIVA domain-containing protein [Oscillospiraceae bacterium]